MLTFLDPEIFGPPIGGKDLGNSLIKKEKTILNPVIRNITLLIVCVFAFFVNLGVFEPDLMEARNFVTAREIIQNDQWLLPTMNGELRLEKPPFPTWLSAMTMRYFGDSMFSMRFPAALIASLLIFFFYRFSRDFFGSDKYAFAAALILASSPLMIEMGRTGSWDIFCQAFIMGAIFFLYKGLTIQENSKRNLLWGGIFIGLSSMSKGPVAIYGMLLPFLISYFTIFGWSALKGKKGTVLWTTVIAVLVACWWYLYARLEAPDMSAAVAKKEIAAWSNRHERPFWFYLHFPVFTGIWSVFVVAAFFFKRYVKIVSDTSKYRFALLWVLSAVVLLSIIPEKKERYLLPVIPPMALLAGVVFQCLSNTLESRDKTNTREQVVFFIFGVLLELALIAAPVAAYLLFYQAGYISIMQWAGSAVILAALFLANIWFIRKRQLWNMLNVVIVFMALVVTFILPGVPAFHYKNPDFKDVSEIQQMPWYGQYNFYSPDQDLNLKAIWRIGKEVRIVDTTESAWPEETFVLISAYSPQRTLGKKMYNKAKVSDLGTYDYYRKKSKFKLYVHKIDQGKD